jgi:uncharacterized RDD family membrane protein YckC
MYEGGVTREYHCCFHHITRVCNRRMGNMGAASKSSASGASTPPSSYPGERLRLPETGRSSVARVGRRLVAFAIDWSLAIAVVLLLSRTDYVSLASRAGGQLAVLGAFVLMQILALWVMAASVGHRIMGLTLVHVRGGQLNFWRPVVRSILLALAVPALVWDSDQRGFHDKIAGTVLLRSR